LDALIGRVHQVTPRLAGSEHRHFFFVRETFNDLRSFAAQTAFTDALVGLEAAPAADGNAFAGATVIERNINPNDPQDPCAGSATASRR